jgi:hypothetical protein
MLTLWEVQNDSGGDSGGGVPPPGPTSSCTLDGKAGDGAGGAAGRRGRRTQGCHCAWSSCTVDVGVVEAVEVEVPPLGPSSSCTLDGGAGDGAGGDGGGSGGGGGRVPLLGPSSSWPVMVLVVQPVMVVVGRGGAVAPGRCARWMS